MNRLVDCQIFAPRIIQGIRSVSEIFGGIRGSKARFTFLEPHISSFRRIRLRTRDAFFPNSLPTLHRTAGLQIITGQLPADYGSLPTNYRRLYGFYYKARLPLPVIYRQC